MGKYGEALGIWDLKVGGADFKLHPKKGDNMRVMEAMKISKERKDETFMIKETQNIMREIISRDYPPLDDKEKEELEMYLEFNAIKLMEELLVAFRWTTRDKLEKTKSELIKKEGLIP